MVFRKEGISCTLRGRTDGLVMRYNRISYNIYQMILRLYLIRWILLPFVYTIILLSLTAACQVTPNRRETQPPLYAESSQTALFSLSESVRRVCFVRYAVCFGIQKPLSSHAISSSIALRYILQCRISMRVFEARYLLGVNCIDG